MDKRIEAHFEFKGKAYIANVLVREVDDVYKYIINLFDKELNNLYPYSYTFIGENNKFYPAKEMSVDNLELIEAIKEAIRRHPDNPYTFID